MLAWCDWGPVNWMLVRFATLLFVSAPQIINPHFVEVLRELGDHEEDYHEVAADREPKIYTWTGYNTKTVCLQVVPS